MSSAARKGLSEASEAVIREALEKAFKEGLEAGMKKAASKPLTEASEKVFLEGGEAIAKGTAEKEVLEKMVKETTEIHGKKLGTEVGEELSEKTLIKKNGDDLLKKLADTTTEKQTQEVFEKSINVVTKDSRFLQIAKTIGLKKAAFFGVATWLVVINWEGIKNTSESVYEGASDAGGIIDKVFNWALNLLGSMPDILTFGLVAFGIYIVGNFVLNWKTKTSSIRYDLELSNYNRILRDQQKQEYANYLDSKRQQIRQRINDMNFPIENQRQFVSYDDIPTSSLGVKRPQFNSNSGYIMDGPEM